MKSYRNHKLALLLAFAVTLATWIVNGDEKGDELAIVTSNKGKLEGVTTAELQKYFKAEKTKAPDGTKLVIVMLDVGRPERDAALRSIYKMNEAEYNDYFVGQTFTGAVQASPKSLPNPTTMKKYVADTPGAVGYLRASDADDSVKVLKIDGKLPGEAGYSLKLK